MRYQAKLKSIGILLVIAILAVGLSGCKIAFDEEATVKINPKNLYQDVSSAGSQKPQSVESLIFNSSGSDIYGQILTPDSVYSEARPVVIMLHGFAGFTKMDEIGAALCRAGCVVIIPYHRGAWGSHGTYSFSNCIEDAKNLADYATGDDFSKKYHTDRSGVILIGHSLGGNTAVNTAVQSKKVNGLVLLAPCDMGKMASEMSEEELRPFLVDNGAEAVHCGGVDALVTDAKSHAKDWRFPDHADKLKDMLIYIATGDKDDVCPAEKMTADFVKALDAAGGSGVHAAKSYPADHSLASVRVTLTRDIAAFIAGMK